MLPLTISLFQVHADALDITTVSAYGEFFSLRLERDNLDSGTGTLLANHLFQPDPSSIFSEGAHFATLLSSVGFSSDAL